MTRNKSHRMSTARRPPPEMSRRQQFVETYQMTKKTDPRIGLSLLGVFLVAAGVGFALFWLLPGSGVIAWIMAIVGGAPARPARGR